MKKIQHMGDTESLGRYKNKHQYFFCKKKSTPERLLVLKALRVGPQMHQSSSLGPSTGAIWNNSLFLWLYESVDKGTSPQRSRKNILPN